jgi:hypothetical protein
MFKWIGDILNPDKSEEGQHYTTSEGVPYISPQKTLARPDPRF